MTQVWVVIRVFISQWTGEQSTLFLGVADSIKVACKLVEESEFKPVIIAAVKTAINHPNEYVAAGEVEYIASNRNDYPLLKIYYDNGYTYELHNVTVRGES